MRNAIFFNVSFDHLLYIRYIGVGDNEEVQLFYVFVESERNPAQDPLVLRFGAGPGCSGLHGFFFESGTFLILNLSIFSQRKENQILLNPMLFHL